MIKLGLLGANGRIGKEIQTLLKGNASFQLAAAPQRGENLDALLTCDVVIDFSSPDALRDYCLQCDAHTRVPKLVSGTTGMSAEGFSALKTLSSKTSVLHAANMSLGILWLQNVLSSIPSYITKNSNAWEMTEAHHQLKKDAPSGTAKMLAETLDKQGIHLSNPIHSIRQGDEVGTHTLTVRLPDEMITLKHAASSRRCFALGALEAALWIVTQPAAPGMYTLQDMINTR